MKFFETYDAREGEKLKVFYKKLLDQVPDVIFKMVCYKDDLYSINYISESVTEMYELSVEEILKDSDVVFNKRVIDEDKPLIIEALQTSKATLKTCTVEFRMDLPAKGLRWFKLIAKPEGRPDGVVNFYGRVADITEQKEQEQKIKMSQERYQFALKAASEGVWDWDVKTT